MLAVLFLIGIATQAIVVVRCGDDSTTAPKPPVFAENYRVTGSLSLPYAELNEPFNAWYDKKTARSRTDYYGDLYKIYQYEHTEDRYGAMYKFVYVPSSFHTANEQKPSPQRRGLIERVMKKVHPRESHANSRTRQACFFMGSGPSIKIQSVLPDLASFAFDSVGECPQANSEFRGKKCELWKMTTNVGDKTNTYKMWVSRNETSNEVVPVHYYMLGYDTLLGSHYDRYDVTYTNFKANVVVDHDFLIRTPIEGCNPMPGPGDDATSGERRSHVIVNNPIHEFVEDPHNHDHVDHEFEKFTKNHGKVYDDLKHHRSSWYNFLHNFRFINGKNRELKHYKLKVNRYADTNVRDLSYLRGRFHSKGYNGGLDYAQHHNLKGSNGALKKDIPESWDWNLQGGVTPVKDQAVCGSCWSFGTSGTIEGAYFAKTGKLPKLSEQQMIDCSWQYGNNGCDGGEDFRAYQYIIDAGGLASEGDYGKYMGIDGKCHANEVEKTVKITGFYNVTRDNPDELKHAIVNYGPVTVAIDASRPTFTFYSHGAYFDEKCNNDPDGLDHQVLVTGYAKVDGKPVWIVKNSWSTYWGNSGYIMMSAEKNNCGILDVPTVPIIEL